MQHVGRDRKAGIAVVKITLKYLFVIYLNLAHYIFIIVYA